MAAGNAGRKWQRREGRPAAEVNPGSAARLFPAPPAVYSGVPS
jgi:hypothetical protein